MEMILILIGFFVLGIIFLLGYLVWRLGIGGQYIVLLLIGFFLFSLYEAIFPFDDFYKREFENVAGMPFPQSGKIIKKYSTYPDVHGDYYSCALIRVSKADYINLRDALLNASTKSVADASDLCKPDNSWKELDFGYELSQAETNSKNETRVWGILKGGTLVYISFSSW